MINKKRLKVLIIPSDYTSGIGSMAIHLANSLKNIDIYFFSSSNINRKKKQFEHLLSKVDIVHWLANLSWINSEQRKYLFEFNKPKIATIHHVEETLIGYGENEEKNKIPVASHCDMIQVVSEEWFNYVQSRTNTPVFLAHHAIDPQKFRMNIQKKRKTKNFIIGNFGFARKINDRKRLDILLQSLIILKNRNFNFELLVQGPNWKELSKPFLQAGINITNLGFLSTKKAKESYKLLDLYVCSSDIEGGPLTVLESLASGVPVVSTKVGISIEALAIGGGILVDKGDSVSMANSISKIMDDTRLYQQFSHEALQVSEYFSWKNVEKEYMRMYFEAINLRNTSIKKSYFFPAKIQRSFQLFFNQS